MTTAINPPRVISQLYNVSWPWWRFKSTEVMLGWNEFEIEAQCARLGWPSPKHIWEF